jgi:hypothetical protein
MNEVRDSSRPLFDLADKTSNGEGLEPVFFGLGMLGGRSSGGACSRMKWAFVPPMPKEDTAPTRNDTDVGFHGSALVGKTRGRDCDRAWMWVTVTVQMRTAEERSNGRGNSLHLNHRVFLVEVTNWNYCRLIQL